MLTRASRPFWIWLALCAPAAFLVLHTTAVLPLIRQTATLSDIEHQQGSAYTASFERAWPSRLEPAIVVLENDRALPFPNMATTEVVAREGQGRFRAESGLLYFSSSDNSDPRTNGRRYAIVQPWPIGRIQILFWLVAVAATAWVVIACRAALLDFTRSAPLAVPVAIVIALFVANRAWLFLDFPLVAIHPDSGNYYALAEQMAIGRWVNVGNRPPVYPLFLKAVFAIDNRAIAVAAAQCALSLLGALLLVYGVRVWRRSFAIAAAVVMALFLLGTTAMEHDTAILSESLYTTFLTISFGALMVALRRVRGAWFALSSSAMGLAILTRPAGMFFLGTYAIVAAWLLWNRRPGRLVTAFMIPLPLLLTMMSAYNYRAVGVFAPTTWGEANFAVATLLSWETDPSYPPEINNAVTRIHDVIYGHMAQLGKDPSVLDTSWNPEALSPAFLESFNQPALDIALVMGGNYETSARPWIRRIGLDAIRKHPMRYLRFVYAMSFNYFSPTIEEDFRSYLMNRAEVLFVERRFSMKYGNSFMARLGKEYAEGQPPSRIFIASTDPEVKMDQRDRIVVEPTWWWRVYHFTMVMRRLVFSRSIWPLGLFAALICSSIALVRSHARDPLTFVIFIIGISAVGASLVVCLVEYSQPRYSYPMEWTYGIATVMLPLLFMRRPLNES